MTKSNKPLYEVIYRHYGEKIMNGELKPGSKLPSETEISSEFDVSRITAVRALKELEMRQLIYRVKGSGSFVNEEDAIGKQRPTMDSSNLKVISLVMPLEDTSSSEIFSGIEDIAKENSYFVTIHNTTGDPKTEREIVEEIIERGSHGVIVYPSSTNENHFLYSSLLIDSYPFVIIDKKLPGLETSLVWADNQKAFYDLTNHLFDQGHKRIVFAGTDVFSISSELERYNGFCKAHLDRNIPLLQKHLFSSNEIHKIAADFMPEDTDVVRECHHLLKTLQAIPKNERPTAITTVNDQAAAAIITVAIKLGLNVPEDYAITGFDNLPFAPYLVVPLTTVAQPAFKIGQEAARQLFSTISAPDRKPTITTIESHLIVRQSSLFKREK